MNEKCRIAVGNLNKNLSLHCRGCAFAVFFSANCLLYLGMMQWNCEEINKVKTGSKDEVRVLLVDFGGQKLVRCAPYSSFYSMDI